MSAELQAELFTIHQRELLRRPLKRAIAIDPANPVEIDDAISVESLGHGVYEIGVHVADAGLLLGQTALLDSARRKGWTHYAEPRTSGKDDLMLPKVLAVDKLGLDIDHYGLGAPAVTVGFTFDSNMRRVQALDIYKSRVDCEVITYGNFNRRLLNGNKKALTIARLASLLNQDIDTPSEFALESRAHDTVGEMMVGANRLIAEEMRKHQIPWLYRNHRQKVSARLRDFDATDLYQTVADLLDTLGRGRYSSIPERHEGMNLMPYSHFTSPLRRLPDLINHLTLHALLTGQELPFTQDELDIIAEELALKTVAEIGAISALYSDTVVA